MSFDLLTEPHARIEPFGSDVHKAVIDDDIGLDVGIVPQKLRQLRPEHRFVGMVTDGDPNSAGRPLPEIAQGVELGLNLLEPRADVAQEALAGLRG